MGDEAQHPTDALCFPSSLHMVIGYFSSFHLSPAVRSGLPRLSYDDVVSLCAASEESGTRLSDELMGRIGQRLKVLVPSMKRDFTLDEVARLWDKALPTILIYDGRYLLTELPGSYHAGVYVGRAKDGDPILQNPWFGPYYPADRIRFQAAWERKSNRAIVFEVDTQTALTEAT